MERSCRIRCSRSVRFRDGHRTARPSVVCTCVGPARIRAVGGLEPRATMRRWRSSRTGPASGLRELGLADLLIIRIRESGFAAFEEVLQRHEKFRPSSPLTNDVLRIIVGEFADREVDCRPARLLLKLEYDCEVGRATGPLECDALIGLPRGDTNGPLGPPERKDAARAGFGRGVPARLTAGRPMVELRGFGERAEYLGRRSLNEDGEAQFATGQWRVVRPHAVGSTLRDGLQIPKAHPPRVLHRSASRVFDRDSKMTNSKQGLPRVTILELIRDARLRRSDRPGERKPPEHFAFIDGRVP